MAPMDRSTAVSCSCNIECYRSHELFTDRVSAAKVVSARGC